MIIQIDTDVQILGDTNRQVTSQGGGVGGALPRAAPWWVEQSGAPPAQEDEVWPRC